MMNFCDTFRSALVERQVMMKRDGYRYKPHFFAFALRTYCSHAADQRSRANRIVGEGKHRNNCLYGGKLPRVSAKSI